MTVFKGCMLLIKRNMGQLLMYFGIFIAIACLMNQVNHDDDTKKYSATENEISIVDLDKSELSEELIAYLSKKHNVTIEKDDKSKLSEELYYGKKDAILRIEKGFSKKAVDGRTAIGLTQRPGSYAGMYLKQQINQFTEDVMMYHRLGYSIQESSKKVAKQPKAKVELEDLNGNGGKAPVYSYFFMYFPYLFISALGIALGKVLVSFRKENVRVRMMSSPVSLMQQNAGTILAFIVVGTLLYGVCFLIAAAMYGGSMLAASNFPYYFLNGYIMLLAALEMAYIMGLIAKKENVLDMIITPISLGLCFLCGVFVPMSVLSAPIRRIASFFPVYWYEKVNGILQEYADISGAIGRQLWRGIGIQCMFLVALAGVAMAVAKYQQQKR